MRTTFALRVASYLCLAIASSFTSPAQAADGCAALLCFSSNWRNIAVCHPIVKEVLKDLRRGGSFPKCDTGGAATGYEPAWAPGNCPPQYTQILAGESTPQYRCSMLGVARVVVNGEPWSNVWFDEAEDTSTEYLSGARRQLAPEQMDPRFERDFAVWAAQQPPPAPPGLPPLN